MSRHHITTSSGDRYVYGYDNPTQQYFLDCIRNYGDDLGDQFIPVVGFGSTQVKWSYGSKTALVEAMDQLNLWHLIPTNHQTVIALDLPIPNAGDPITVFENGRFRTETF
jgi:hypothetical protein